MRVVYRGNFGVGYSTESHVAASLESLDVEVERIQEDAQGWAETLAACNGADLFLWTSTHSYAHRWNQADARAAVAELNKMLPTVAFHLDRFIGLHRERQIRTEPWFGLQHVLTADGDPAHQEVFESVGINHHWLPPAVYHSECYDGSPRQEFDCDVAFVGSWSGYAHKEWWPQRRTMLDALRAHYGLRFRCFPEPGQSAVRGAALNDLYASVKVTVGDSCLAPNANGEPISGYWSDRVPEATGRGGLLVHPYVKGILNVHPNLPTFALGDHDQMLERIDHLLDHDEDRGLLRKQNAEQTREHNTYRMRMIRLLDVVGLGRDSEPSSEGEPEDSAAS